MMEKPIATENLERAESVAAAFRPFAFERDTFSFANELIWEYHFDAVAGRTTFSKRSEKPSYAHRCFVMASAARQFFFHAVFDPTKEKAGDDIYRKLVRSILSRSPRHPSEPRNQVRVPGFEGLRQFSRDREDLLKSECGGAWRSYILRSHWRMVFPISRDHQSRTASQLVDTIKSKGTAIVHLVRFPTLSINHGMVLYSARSSGEGLVFDAYDPNVPAGPAGLTFNNGDRTFHLPANTYWAGGGLNVIEICRNLLM
jgi:hypothetical protein